MLKTSRSFIYAISLTSLCYPEFYMMVGVIGLDKFSEFLKKMCMCIQYVWGVQGHLVDGS